MKRQDGFTLIELLVTMFLATLLFTGGALALRQFWFVRSLEGGADEVHTQLRRQQERAISESNPLVYGARFRPGSSEWSLVQYDPRRPADVCKEVTRLSFDTGVEVEAVDFVDAPDVTSECQGLTPLDPDGAYAAGDDFVFFYARGSATEGSITIWHPRLDRRETITVSAITGRVDRQ